MNLMLDMCRKKILVLALFSIYFLSTEAANGSFPALLAFGDSILDTGNNNYLLTLMKGNIWPYGRSMIRPTGRFGNGRVFSDIISMISFSVTMILCNSWFIYHISLILKFCFFLFFAAEGLGIKKMLPAYRKLFIPPSDLKTGVCFASGGAGVDPVTSRMLVKEIKYTCYFG